MVYGLGFSTSDWLDLGFRVCTSDWLDLGFRVCTSDWLSSAARPLDSMNEPIDESYSLLRMLPRLDLRVLSSIHPYLRQPARGATGLAHLELF